MEENATLSHRAEVFRSKLIEDFQILECTSEEGRRKAPVYTSAEIISKLDNLLLGATVDMHVQHIHSNGRAWNSRKGSY